jgi:small subunit ribosomal protein S13
MPRIAGIDIPNDKRIDISLTYIYGIGRINAQKILAQAKINPATKAKDLSSQDVQEIVKVLSTIPVEGELRKIVRDNIELLKRIGSYRGLRHSMKLPCHGQRTRTNARTMKGAKKTVGSMTKEARAKIEGTTTK